MQTLTPDTPSDGTAPASPRIVVLVRGHELSPKYRSLLDDLVGHEAFDTVALYRHPGEKLAEYPCPVITYQLDDMRALGFEPDGELFLYLCGDLLLEHVRRRLPDYDYYIMIEYDVEAGDDHGSVMDDIAAAIRIEHERGLDMVAPDYLEVRWPWAHAPNAARFFDRVWAAFFPFVIVSRRAVERIHRFRLEEGPPDLPTADRVICEALGSIFMIEPGYRAMPLQELLEGAYDYWTFYFGMPMLQRVGAPGGPTARLRHPVYSAEGFCLRHFTHMQAWSDVRQFIAALDEPGLPIPAELLQAYREGAMHMPDATAPWRLRPATRAADAPPAILLVVDDDMGVRDRGALPRAMTMVAGRPVFRHVLDRLLAAGVRDIVVCVGPGSTSVRRRIVDEFFGPDADADGRADGMLAVPSRPGSDVRLWLGPTAGDVGTRWGAAFDRIGDQRALLVLGNVWADIDLRALLDAHEAAGAAMTLATAEGCSWSLALDEAVRKVGAYRPGLHDLRVEAGMAVLEPETYALLRRPAMVSGDLLLSLVERRETFAHTGFCQTLNSEREVALFHRLVDRHPGLLDPP